MIPMADCQIRYLNPDIYGPTRRLLSERDTSQVQHYGF